VVAARLVLMDGRIWMKTSALTASDGRGSFSRDDVLKSVAHYVYPLP